MLIQNEVDYLLNLVKVLSENRNITLPNPGQSLELGVNSANSNEKFIVDINRKGTINIQKVTYQTRYQRSVVLLRLDIEGSPHKNPDEEIIPCPHLHIFREGFGTSWAYPLDKKIITETTDLVQVLIAFLKYNNVTNIPPIQQYLI
ncbi:hypothetical protein PaeBR_01270 [Paenibacillus sp. BR2-3]|uniref:DUF6978 family protein n=1 Tax=Paenibacillus sp. BR2-3 TaxID=3048494 RepID=UPI003977E08D